MSSRRASLLSRRSCRSISWLIRFCSLASSERQHSILKPILFAAASCFLFCFAFFFVIFIWCLHLTYFYTTISLTCTITSNPNLSMNYYAKWINHKLFILYIKIVSRNRSRSVSVYSHSSENNFKLHQSFYETSSSINQEYFVHTSRITTAKMSGNK